MTTEHMNTDTPSAEITEIFRGRRSGVAFDAHRTVDTSTLRHIFEAARWAPSCFNEQPWRYVICRKDSEKDAWNAVFETLVDKNRAWCQHAPAFVIICAQTTFSHNDLDNPWCVYDTGAATVSAVYEATRVGLMAHQMAGFNADAVRERFQIPDGYKAVTIMAIGFPAPADQIPNEFAQREALPRTRKSIEEIVSFGTWSGLA